MVRIPAFCSPKVRRQHVLAGFILDFYCPKLHLAIELDGAGHYTPEGLAKDEAQTAILEAHGVRMVRFENKMILEELGAVILLLEGLGVAPSALRATSPPFGE